MGDTVLYGNAFIIKLDDNGTIRWARSFGGTGRALTTDAVGNCYATGNFENNTTIGNITLNSNGFDDFFVVKTGNVPLSVAGAVAERTGVLLYPNPVTGNELMIKLNGKGNFTLYNTTGQQLHHQQIIEGKQVIPLRMPPGIYIARIGTAAGVTTEKIVVQ